MTLSAPDHILTVTKEEAASRQVAAAIHAFVQGNFDIAITLAGAAEGMLERSGLHLFKFMVEHPSVAAVDKGKELIPTLNFERDWLKHSSGPESIQIIRADAAFMIIRAASKIGSWPPIFYEFRDWVIANLDTLGDDPRANLIESDQAREG